MEIVSSCNHRYTPILRESSLSLSLSLSLYLGAYRFECALRQGKRNIGTGGTDRTWKIRVFFSSLILPALRPRLRIRETVLFADITVRFSDAVRRHSELELRQKSGPPTTIHRCTSRSLCELVPRYPNVDLHRYCTRAGKEIVVL